MLKKLEEMRSVAIDKINQAATQLELNECRAEYLGKKSPLNEIMKQIRHGISDSFANNDVKIRSRALKEPQKFW